MRGEKLECSDGLPRPSDYEDHLSIDPWIGATGIQFGSVVQIPQSVVPAEGTLSKTMATPSCPSLDSSVLVRSEDSGGVMTPLDLERLGMANGDVEENLNPSAETEVTGVLSKLELASSQQSAQGLETLRANLEGCINAFSQKALHLTLEFKRELQRLGNVLQQQESILSIKDKEVATLKGETQKYCERITQLQSQAAKLPEYLDMVGKIKSELGRDDILASEIGELFVQLHRDEGTLRDELSKSSSQLEFSKHDVDSKTRENEQLKTDVHGLEEAIIKLEDKVEKIQQQLCKERLGYDGSYVDGMPTPFLLESTAKDVFSSIATFSKVFSKYTNPHGYNPAQRFVSTVLLKGLYLTRQHHWTSLLKSFICRCVFDGFESEALVRSNNTTLFLNSEERARSCLGYFERSNKKGVLNTVTDDAITNLKFDSLFEAYFVSISQAILPPNIQQLYTYFTMQGDLVADAKDLPESGAEINVMQSLILAAKKVWDFHKLCLSFEPPVTIFRVAAGETFDPNYMDSSVALEDDPKFAPKVGFMIYPGFRLRKSIIKCEVYFGVQA